MPHRQRRPPLAELARILGTLALVMAATAGALRALDAVPRYLLGEARGVRAYATIDEAEARAHRRLLVPGYFPDSLRWPPATVRVEIGPPLAVALTFVAATDGEERLLVVQSFGAPPSHSTQLLPGATRLHAMTIALHSSEGRLTRIAAPDGRIWHEVSWQSGDRHLILRFRGAVEELLRMARTTGT